MYNPIDLNHIFDDDDISDEWIQEGEEPTLSSKNLDWLDQELFPLKKVEKQIVKMMVAQVTGLVGMQAVLCKKETLIILLKVQLLE